MFLYRLLRFLSLLLCKLFFHLEVYGKEFIPQSGGFVLSSNHTSYLDPILLAVACPRILNFAARDSLFWNRPFARLLREVGAFPIKRWSADLSAVRESVRRLKNSFGLVVFPEGTRSVNADIQHITHGFVLLADKADVPVIPARILGSHNAWAKSKKIFRPAKVRVVFGRPVYHERRHSYAYTAQEIFGRIKHLRPPHNSSVDKSAYF